MEFNADGSLKVDKSDRKQEPKATITKTKLPGNDTGMHLIVKLNDESLPYNLIEGHFHQITTDDGTQAKLGKKSETEYDIVINGEDYDTWVSDFCKALADFLDNQIEING